MGLKPSGRPSEPLRPCLREIDVDRGVVVRELRYEVAPAHAPSPRAHQEFTAAALLPDGRLLQPAHTELLWIDPDRLRVDRVVSHPLFHGVHSAAPEPDGGAILTCAGTESVLEVDPAGGVRAHHWLRDGAFAAAYPGIDDFRRVDHDALKPHSHHPNHALRVGADLWVTCFEPQDCRSITRPGRRIPLPEAIPHDGRLRGGWLWFTQIVGRIVAVDPVTLERRLELDLRELAPGGGLLGWCRGIEVVGSRLFVGMSALRHTRHREVLRQLLGGGPRRPARIVEVDLDRGVVVREIPVGNDAGGTIYSVLAPPGAAG
ncbi:MAG: hypothetical protein R3F59_24690 [Myxococcota bacterium]